MNQRTEPHPVSLDYIRELTGANLFEIVPGFEFTEEGVEYEVIEVYFDSLQAIARRKRE